LAAFGVIHAFIEIMLDKITFKEEKILLEPSKIIMEFIKEAMFRR